MNRWFRRAYLGFELSVAVLGIGIGLMDLARLGTTYYAGVFVFVLGILLTLAVGATGLRPGWVYVLAYAHGIVAWWFVTWGVGFSQVGGFTGGGNGSLPGSVALLGVVVPSVAIPLGLYYLVTFYALVVVWALPVVYGKRTTYDPSNGKRRM